MIRGAIFFVVILLSHQKTFQYESDVTLDVRERVELLKRQIYDEIEEDQKNIVARPVNWVRHQKSAELDDNYEYKDTDGKQPITPIMDNDERKFKDRFKHKPLYTKKPSTFVASPEVFSVSPIKNIQRSRKKKKKLLRSARPKEIFYRRFGVDFDIPVPTIHRHDLLTPFLMSGEPLNATEKVVHATDANVLRLVHLLSENTREETKDEIYSVLYQISNIPIRLFQWETEAVKLLFDQIIPGDNHNFHTLKRGLKDLFINWHLDIGNVTNLLRQTRIFRPPCCTVSELSGSTKKPKGARFTKAKETKKTCPPVPDSSQGDTCEY